MAQTAHTEVPAHGAAHKAGFPPFESTYFPSQLLWLALTFGFLWWMMAKVIVPRLTDIIETRRDRISKDLGEAQRLKDETEAAIKGYDKALADARAKAQAIANETRAALNAEVEAKRHAAEAGLNEKLAAAEARIGEIKAQALGEVGGIATDTATALVNHLLGGTAGQDEISAAVAAAMQK
ncbi:MAG: F0F1 ATP synthase subunit B [Hyphomicrobiaceae bacterium]|nr:F0F1 ATP synthase subunit B [Hyphomicrobiaceae bacterium]